MLFVIRAVVSDTPEAQALLNSLRPAHMKTVQSMAEDGRMWIGGALTEPGHDGSWSFSIVDFPDRAALDAWVADHPYSKNGIWTNVNISLLKPAPPFLDGPKPL